MLFTESAGSQCRRCSSKSELRLGLVFGIMVWAPMPKSQMLFIKYKMLPAANADAARASQSCTVCCCQVTPAAESSQSTHFCFLCLIAFFACLLLCLFVCLFVCLLACFLACLLDPAMAVAHHLHHITQPTLHLWESREIKLKIEDILLPIMVKMFVKPLNQDSIDGNSSIELLCPKRCLYNSVEGKEANE